MSHLLNSQRWSVEGDREGGAVWPRCVGGEYPLTVVTLLCPVVIFTTMPYEHTHAREPKCLCRTVDLGSSGCAPRRPRRWPARDIPCRW
eukprot:3740490-Prymnesium_polylepis.1